ncbi:MAG TPA: aminotransferase class V-fold PLP-dependent enzyme [Nitrolancea sp.]|nr:aminotransferase class V-fold PLP-dependent enzyme [Nitrolancea sp.]
MTVELATLRAEFPIAEEWAYLNHAAIGPFSRRTEAAIAAVSGAFARPPSMGNAYGEAIETARGNVAKFVGGTPDGVAFVGSLADAMSLVAAGIDWHPGDNVVMPQEEFPSNVYPFLNLGRLGVELRMVEKDEQGFTSLERVAAAMDGHTRAVVLSHVEFMTGYKNDLDALGRLCQEHGALSVVDATQSMGALPIDVAQSGIDVIAAHGYKWLMASFGLGVVHLSERAIEAIHPVYVGRLSVALGFEELEYRIHWQPGARRYQTGGINWLGVAAFNASATLIEAAEPARTAAHCLALTDRLLAGVAELGYQVTSCLDPAHRSQIVSFSSGDRDTDERLVENLEAQQVSTTLRGRGVRVSPYFYNTEADIDRLLELLPPR